MSAGHSLQLKDDPNIPYFEWMTPKINPENAVFIGWRQIDEFEKKVITRNSLKGFTMFDIEHEGIKTVMDKVIDYLSLNKGFPFLIHFDLDSIDPLIAPGVSHKCRGGLTYREIKYIMRSL